MPYIGNQPGTGVRSRFIYTATASQTTFSGADNNSKTLKYADSDYIDVYLNGVCLVPGTDYTASTKTSVVLTQAASVSDTLEVVAYDIATISDTVSKADGGTFEGDLGITNSSPDLTLTNNTTEDTDGGRESTVIFKGEQSGGEITTLAEIEASHAGTSDDEKGHLIFRTNDGNDGTSPTERLRIDSSGSVGIGVSPDSTVSLDVQNLSASSNNVFLRIKNATNQEDSGLIIEGQNGGAREYKIGVNSIANSPDLTFSGPTGYRYYVGGTERMRIDSSGNVFINTLNDMGGILNVSHADGVAIGSANDQTYYRRIYGTAGANLELRFWNGSNEGSLNSSGAWVNASDVSLKENIADIEYGIDTVKSLKPRKYTMKEGGNSEVGFIAQEMESVVPEVVNTSENPDGDEIKGISYGQLNAVLTKALQEAIAKIETLETKVAALEDA